MKPEEAKTVDHLVALSDAGVELKYVFFWGHTPRIPNQIDQSCLSNWFPADFNIDGTRYPTVEHYMMAEKARLFGDLKIRDKILDAENPGKAKKLGRTVSNFDESTWELNRLGIVAEGCHAKFKQNRKLGDLLLSTGSKVLVEASPSDRIWGIGMGKDHEHAKTPSRWQGLNLLGFALMAARKRLTEDA